MQANNDEVIGDGYTTGCNYDNNPSDDNSNCFDDETEYPILGPSTTQKDLDEALWILKHCRLLDILQHG